MEHEIETAWDVIGACRIECRTLLKWNRFSV